jgi:hypothetical protein
MCIIGDNIDDLPVQYFSSVSVSFSKSDNVAKYNSDIHVLEEEKPFESLLKLFTEGDY